MLRSKLGRVVTAVALLVGGCEYDLDVAAEWEITRPRVITFRMELVEPAPIWLERLDSGVDDAPIAEALPGDRVRMVPLVVDGESRPQAPESIDAIWFQCTADEHSFDCLSEVPRCDSLDAWTTDVGCELGRGRGFEFTIPKLGPLVFEERSMKLLGIIGRTPDADAERCRAGLVAGTSELSDCTLVEAPVAIGPRWVLQHVAVEVGLEPELPLYEIPYLAMLQPANRVQEPGAPVWLDAETGEPLAESPPQLRRGQRVKTSGPIWADAQRQPYASLWRSVLLADFENRGARYFASGPIWLTEVDVPRLEFVVDEDARPGMVRVVVVVGDRRGGDPFGAINMFVSELEVVP
ncbi:MAG TPA: hypothetical protein VM869_28810 [Enhygromyxa sp.]|nr:hypothetical protein [Enhygromyxa sp.]